MKEVKNDDAVNISYIHRTNCGEYNVHLSKI